MAKYRFTGIPVGQMDKAKGAAGSISHEGAGAFSANCSDDAAAEALKNKISNACGGANIRITKQ